MLTLTEAYSNVMVMFLTILSQIQTTGSKLDTVLPRLSPGLQKQQFPTETRSTEIETVKFGVPNAHLAIKTLGFISLVESWYTWTRHLMGYPSYN